MSIALRASKAKELTKKIKITLKQNTYLSCLTHTIAYK